MDWNRFLRDVLFTISQFMLYVIVCQGDDNTPCICLQSHISNLVKPLFLAHTIDAGDIDRFFVLEKDGQILEFPMPNGEQSPNVYLDISDRVAKASSPFAHIGLLGLALHPNFASTWKVYVYYMRRSSGNLFAVVSEFKAKTKYKADPESERILLKIPHARESENGGHIFFGPDGYLYISVGDGGLEEEGFAQNSLSLLGKILRIDVNGREDIANYSIPLDNPYQQSKEQGRKEIYALGARNMWRCSVDTGNQDTGEGRGRIFCGDVGHERFEEVNIIESGGNYGWNEREGFQCRENKHCHDISGREVLPISAYEHTVTRAVVIGGYVYRGKTLTDLQGQYIFGDASSGEFFRLTDPKNEKSEWPSNLLKVCEKSRCPCTAREDAPRHILSFSADKHDELYVLTTTSLISPSATGSIYQIVSPINPGTGSTCSAVSCQSSILFTLLLLMFVYKTSE